MDSKDRSFLRSKAQTLKSVVMVGKAGMTDDVCNALRDALECHELVKVKFQSMKDKDKVHEMTEALSRLTGSEPVAETGFTALFYRRAGNPENHRIMLPSEKIRL